MGNNIQTVNYKINKKIPGKKPVPMTKKKPEGEPVIYASNKCLIKKPRVPVVSVEPEVSVTPNPVQPVVVEEPQVVAEVMNTEPVVETWKEKRERTKKLPVEKKTEETFEIDTKV